MDEIKKPEQAASSTSESQTAQQNLSEAELEQAAGGGKAATQKAAGTDKVQLSDITIMTSVDKVSP